MQEHLKSNSESSGKEFSEQESGFSTSSGGSAMASLPGDPSIQRLQEAANASPQVTQLKRLQEGVNQSMAAPMQLRASNGAPIQRLSIGGADTNLPDLRQQLLPHFSAPNMRIVDRILPVFFDDHNQNYANVETLAGQLQMVVGIYRDLTRTDTMANLIAGQERGQGDFQAFSGQGWFRKLFTTTGFEHEFADMHNSFLAGVSHMEIAQTAETMPLTGIPFNLETDASNALELVSPPFLLPTVSGAPLPDPDVVRAIDDRMRQDLAAVTPAVTPRMQMGMDPLATTTMDGIRQALDGLTGWTFQFSNLQIDPEHLSHRADPHAIAPHLQDPGGGANPNLRLVQQDVEAIEVRRSEKSANERHGVSAQVNFATDLETAETLMDPSIVAGAAIYRTLETELATGLNINGIADENVKRFGKYMVKNLCSLFSVYSQNFIKGQQANFHDDLEQQARHLNGHGGGAGGQGGQGLPLNGQREFRLHAGLCSYVKDSTAIWIKDHLVSQAAGILTTQQMVDGGKNLVRQAVAFANGWAEPAAVTALAGRHHADPTAHWAHFISELQTSARYILGDLQNGNHADDTPGVGLYEHRARYGGARQDTMLDPARVQQPDLWDDRLHVAEIRRGDPSDQLRDAAGRL